MTPDDRPTESEEAVARCEQCGQPRGGNRRFCSSRCYGISQRAYPDGLVCEQCGKGFLVPAGSTPSTRRFCSRDCYLTATRSDMVEKICPVCHQRFDVPAYTAHRYSVCSLACRHAGATYADCPACGKRFNDKRGKRVYCSEACRRPAVYFECANCGKRKRRCPGANPRFCSRRCYLAFGGPTDFERAVGDTLTALGVPFVHQFQVGRRTIDYAVVEQRVAVEADGNYWHNPVKDARRDAQLAEQGWTVVHVLESEYSSADDPRRLVADKIENVAGLRFP